MKTVRLFSMTWFAGLIAGVQLAALGQTEKAAPNLNETDQEATERALGKLYVPNLALSASFDMRIVTLLNSNDVATAKRLLLSDLSRNVISLSAFTNETELIEFHKRILQQGQNFLNKEGYEVPVTPQQRLKRATNALANANSERERFYALNDAAKESFVLGKIEDARKYAAEQLKLLPKFKDDWNYGNAVQDANIVLGRIALREGRLKDAKQFLVQAGNTPGSPQLGSFGPNMSLAKDLLEKGERDAVLEYFTLCHKFWKMEDGQLDEWTKDVKAGKTPEFGPNLIY